MSYIDPIDISLFSLGDLSTFAARDVTDSIISFNVNLSLGNSSQIGVSVVDPNFAMAKANYFQIRRDIFYRNLWFEISAVECQRSDSIHPLYNLECRSKYVQLMKRDKKPEAFAGQSAYDFAATMAARFNMNFVGEQTTKKKAIVKGKNNNADDSVWTVLGGLAQEQQFICFESQNTLFFCSEKFLLGKWGDANYSYGDLKFIPFFWPEATDPLFSQTSDQYILLDQPSVRRSDDDIKAADGTMLVDRTNGKNLRPGMTIYLGGIPDFEGLYLITDVSFEEGSANPVQVQFRTPVDPTKEKISSSGTSSRTGTRTGTRTGDSGDSGSSTTGTKPQFTVAAAQEYARQALPRLGYTGTNGAIIVKLVGILVAKFNLKRPLSEIDSYARSYAGLTIGERAKAYQIYTAFIAGKTVASLGVAGGLSTSAVSSIENDYKDVHATNTASTSGTTPVTTEPSTRQNPPKADSSNQSANLQIPAQSIPSSVNTNITNYILKWGKLLTSQEKYAAIDLVKADAKRIWNMATVAKKADEYKKLYTQYSDFKYQVKYNALRQAVVFNVLVPDSQGTNLNFGTTNPRLSVPISYPVR